MNQVNGSLTQLVLRHFRREQTREVKTSAQDFIRKASRPQFKEHLSKLDNHAAKALRELIYARLDEIGPPGYPLHPSFTKSMEQLEDIEEHLTRSSRRPAKRDE